jgi:Molecular chaperone GrpE (heat shock protein)
MISDEKLKESKEKEGNMSRENEGFREETLEEAEVNEDMEFEELKEEINLDDENKANETELLHIENKRLKDENKKLYNESEALKDRFLRMSAEYENFRKRTEKEKLSIYTDACADVLKHMLPVLDNLERAMSAEGNADDIKKGIEITIRQFNEALQKLKVEEIHSTGEFDPNYHNAIMHIEDDSFGKNEIVEVFQKGFRRDDKILRCSLVKVAN